MSPCCPPPQAREKWVPNQRVQYRKNTEENSTSTSTFYDSWAHSSTLDGGVYWFRLAGRGRQDQFGIIHMCGSRTISWIVRFQGTIRQNCLLCHIPFYAANPQGRTVDFDSAHSIQEVSWKKENCHDRGAYSRARECWIHTSANFSLFVNTSYRASVVHWRKAKSIITERIREHESKLSLLGKFAVGFQSIRSPRAPLSLPSAESISNTSSRVKTGIATERCHLILDYLHVFTDFSS